MIRLSTYKPDTLASGYRINSFTFEGIFNEYHIVASFYAEDGSDMKIKNYIFKVLE